MTFVGLGLNGILSLSKEAFCALEEADEVFIESYTNFLEADIQNSLISQFGKPVRVLFRADLEQGEEAFLRLCHGKKIVLLVSGDPFIATTHVTLRLSAIRKNIPVHIVHAPSILSTAPAVTGLSAYRFGKTATITFQQSRYCYDMLSANLSIEAHTLFLLDIDVESRRFLDISTAISQLRNLEKEYNEKVFIETLFLFGLARIGTKNATIRSGPPSKISEFDWKSLGPPQSMIVCSKLQAYEEEAIQHLWRK
ncbi:MAG: diphthine synthase [Candidatus Hodarchaeales archaeon]